MAAGVGAGATHSELLEGVQTAAWALPASPFHTPLADEDELASGVHVSLGAELLELGVHSGVDSGVHVSLLLLLLEEEEDHDDDDDDDEDEGEAGAGAPSFLSASAFLFSSAGAATTSV